MKIQAFYLSGEVQEFDTQSMFNNSNLFSGYTGLTYISLCYEGPDDGLWLRYRQYNVANVVEFGSDNIPAVRISDHTKYQLLDGVDVANVAWVEMDGRRVLTRVGDSLVDNVKFEAFNSIYATSNSSASFNEKACETFLALIGDEARPGMIPRSARETDEAYKERVAEMMGWEYRILEPFLDAFLSGGMENGFDDDAEGEDDPPSPTF